MSKKMYFAFLSRSEHYFDIKALANGIRNYLFRNGGTDPIYITENAIINNIVGSPMACTYICVDDCERLTISSSNFSAALIVNGTNNTISIFDDLEPLLYLESKGTVFVISDITYNYYMEFIPFGYCTDELSLKESKGDDINLSHATGFVQSKIIDITLPGFNLFQNDKFLDKYIDNLGQMDSVLFSDFDYMYIVSIEDIEDIENIKFTTVVYKIKTDGKTRIEIALQANQPNKGTLTFNKELAINETGIDIITG